MTPFGTYRLVYEPPANTVEGGMEMNISSEANLDQMLDLFAAFLRASGYPIDFAAELVIQEEQPKRTFEDVINDWAPRSNEFWYEDGFSFTGNPVAAGDTVIAGAGVLGGMGQDIISFG